MREVKYEDIVNPLFLIGTIDNNSHPGFLEDYRVLSCLLRSFDPISVFEIGTNIGTGTNIIHAAVPKADIITLDLDYDSMMKDPSQFPIGPNGEDRTGSAINFKCTQLRCDSMAFIYRDWPCEAYFVDGAHDRVHVELEAREIIMTCSPDIVIFHDADMPEVMEGILAAEKNQVGYESYRVTGTRIAFLVKKGHTWKV